MISLVSTVFNDRVGTELFFRRMAAQTHPPDEIVIVDSLSTDGTWEVLRSELARTDRSWKLVAWQERCNVARGRNLAIAHATYPTIASTDIGCDWHPAWLQELMQPFNENPGLAAVMGSWSIRPEDLTSPWAQVEYALLREPRLIATSQSDASSRSIAYTRALWENVGGYPEDLTLAADDMVFSLLLHRAVAVDRLGAAPMIRCHWMRPATLKAFRREARRNFFGAGEADIFSEYGVRVGGRLLLELLLFAFGLVALMSPLSPWLAVGVLLAAFMSFGARAWRLRTAAGIAQSLNVPQPWARLLVFEYATKFSGTLGYWEGRMRGRTHCIDCRRRLRQTKEAAANSGT